MSTSNASKAHPASKAQHQTTIKAFNVRECPRVNGDRSADVGVGDNAGRNADVHADINAAVDADSNADADAEINAGVNADTNAEHSWCDIKIPSGINSKVRCLFDVIASADVGHQIAGGF